MFNTKTQNILYTQAVKHISSIPTNTYYAPSKNHMQTLKRSCLHGYNNPYQNQKFTINLDWLQLNVNIPCITEDLITENIQQGYIEFGDKNIVGAHYVFNIESGTVHFKHRLLVIQDNTHLFTLEAIPRNAKRHDSKTTCILKFENHLLYTDKWHAAYNDFKNTFDVTENKFSRIDIALDTSSYIIDFYNEYLKTQGNKRKGFQQIKQIGKCSIHAHEYNRKTGDFKAFKFGAKRGEKQMTIYNKSKDVKRTGKEYIFDVWQKNGLNPSRNENNIYRHEIRLMNGYIKHLYFEKTIHTINNGDTTYTVSAPKTFNEFLSRLQYSNFLLAIFQQATKNFFEFIKVNPNDSNITRSKRLQLFPTSSDTVYKTKRHYYGTPFKAKMSIHNHFKDALRAKIPLSTALKSIRKSINNYHLQNWYDLKKQQWYELYSSSIVIDSERRKKLHEARSRKLLTINQLTT